MAHAPSPQARLFVAGLNSARSLKEALVLMDTVDIPEEMAKILLNSLQSSCTSYVLSNSGKSFSLVNYKFDALSNDVLTVIIDFIPFCQQAKLMIVSTRWNAIIKNPKRNDKFGEINLHMSLHTVSCGSHQEINTFACDPSRAEELQIYLCEIHGEKCERMTECDRRNVARLLSRMNVRRITCHIDSVMFTFGPTIVCQIVSLAEHLSFRFSLDIEINRDDIYPHVKKISVASVACFNKITHEMFPQLKEVAFTTTFRIRVAVPDDFQMSMCFPNPRMCENVQVIQYTTPKNPKDEAVLDRGNAMYFVNVLRMCVNVKEIVFHEMKSETLLDFNPVVDLDEFAADGFFDDPHGCERRAQVKSVRFDGCLKTRAMWMEMLRRAHFLKEERRN